MPGHGEGSEGGLWCAGVGRPGRTRGAHVAAPMEQARGCAARGEHLAPPPPRQVATTPDTSAVSGQFDWSGFKDGQLWVALITFLYVDFLDATGAWAATGWPRGLAHAHATGGSRARAGLLWQGVNLAARGLRAVMTASGTGAEPPCSSPCSPSGQAPSIPWPTSCPRTSRALWTRRRWARALDNVEACLGRGRDPGSPAWPMPWLLGAAPAPDVPRRRPRAPPLQKRFPRQTAAFMVDGASISIGAALGCTPLTAYVESASGIREGARTGIAALAVSPCASGCGPAWQYGGSAGLRPAAPAVRQDAGPRPRAPAHAHAPLPSPAPPPTADLFLLLHLPLLLPAAGHRAALRHRPSAHPGRRAHGAPGTGEGGEGSRGRLSSSFFLQPARLASDWLYWGPCRPCKQVACPPFSLLSPTPRRSSTLSRSPGPRSARPCPPS